MYGNHKILALVALGLTFSACDPLGPAFKLAGGNACKPSHTGDYTIRSARQAQTLVTFYGHVGEIASYDAGEDAPGDLRIVESSLTSTQILADTSGRGLCTVGGSYIVSGNLDLTEVDLGEIEDIGDGIVFDGNRALSDLVVPQRIDHPGTTPGGYAIEFIENPLLTCSDMEGFARGFPLLESSEVLLSGNDCPDDHDLWLHTEVSGSNPEDEFPFQDLGYLEPDSRTIVRGEPPSDGHEAEAPFSPLYPDRFSFRLRDDAPVRLTLLWEDSTADMDLVLFEDATGASDFSYDSVDLVDEPQRQESDSAPRERLHASLAGETLYVAQVATWGSETNYPDDYYSLTIDVDYY